MKVTATYNLGWLTVQLTFHSPKNLEAYEVRELYEKVYDFIKEVKVAKYNTLDDLKNEIEKIKVENMVLENISFLFDFDERGGVQLDYPTEVFHIIK
jgi:hypothetical protein